MTGDRFRDLCAEYLLTGLEGERLAEFERELVRGGEARQREVERMREVLGSMAMSVEPVAPPPDLGERIVEAIREERERGGPHVVPLQADRRKPARPPRGWIAAAAVLTLIAGSLAIWGVRLQTELTVSRTSLETARERLALLDSTNEALRRLESDLSTMTSPEARTVSLAGTETRPEARARVFVDAVTGRALLFAYELPILPPDSVYQLWAIRGEQPTSVGVFTASRAGPARLDVEEAGVLESADALAVTVEPAPGQPAPTGEMVLIGSS